MDAIALEDNQVGPHHKYLTSESLLIQAWKKSHAFIRRHNWFADSLELDLSTINLQHEIAALSSRFQARGSDFYRPADTRLVLAPKAGAWNTPSPNKVGWLHPTSWLPVTDLESLRLRPLAHLRLQDQVAATAAMICLADCVESAQDDPSPINSYAEDRQESVSLGNRLFCTWQNNRAMFRWGNAETYRKYYADYREFLRRPAMCSLTVPQDQNVAIVQLDLTGFYDQIDRAALIRILQMEASRFYPAEQQSEEFWKILSQIFLWRWHENDLPDLPDRLRNNPRRGLPQGLVASGFFANAYMLPFDRKLKSAIGDASHEYDWTVQGYFRYVDDIRLVVSSTVPISGRLLGAQISEWMNQQLAITAPNQEINPLKTTVDFVRNGAGGVRVSPAMEAIQQQASGPIDVAACLNLLQELDGLFPIAEQAALDRAARSSATSPTTPYDVAGPEVSLDPSAELNTQILDLFITDIDVKPETVERFAANRWRAAYRTLRRFSDGARGEVELPAPLKALDERASLFAKRLIRRWVQDPSLVALLRVAMDVYPDANNLDLVLGLLQPKLFPNEPAKIRKICCYISTELLRAGSTETGFSRDGSDLPASSDIASYRDRLSKFAITCLSEYVDAPWYLRQQALLYLATRGVTTAIIRIRPNDWTDSPQYVQLLQILHPEPKLDREIEPNVAMFLLAHHIVRDLTWIVTQIVLLLKKWSPAISAEFVTQIYQNDSAIGVKIWESTVRRREHKSWREIVRRAAKTFGPTHKKIEIKNKKSYTLTEILKNEPGIFSQENSALILLHRLSIIFRGNLSEVDPDHLSLNSKAWKRLSDPRHQDDRDLLRVRVLPLRKGEVTNPQYATSSWAAPRAQFRLKIGRLLRAAIIGNYDYTAHVHSVPKIIRPYRGLASSWYKRQFGTSQRPQSLVGPSAPMSPWLGELLMALLRWPGVNPVQRYIADWNLIETPEGLIPVIEDRIKHQAKLYGSASNLPIYDMDTFSNRSATSAMTLVMVQTVLPRFADYSATDVGLNSPAYRVRHSRHLAAVAKLVEQSLAARATFGMRSNADLIVFPELAVHEDDLPILERLVDKTGAIIFCGLVFRQIPGSPSFINEGLWIVPDYRPGGREILRFTQGKHHLTHAETKLGVRPCRTHQRIIRGFNRDGLTLWRVTGAICLDATDLQLAADLRDKTDAFIVPALNKDIPTFDHMVESLHYHMYQHFVLVNSGEYGGSTAQAPYRERHEKQIVHCHGVQQAAISICEVDLTHFVSGALIPEIPGATQSRLKTPPAGYNRQPNYA